MRTIIFLIAIALAAAQVNRVCPASTDGNIDWPATTVPVGEYSVTVSMPCPNGADGSVTRVCLFNKVPRWQGASFSCFCPADSIWDKTEGKTLNIQACRGITIGDGDSSAERFCDENYAWDDPIPSKSCICPPLADSWVDVAAGEHVVKQCGVGSLSRKCSVVGTWEEIDNDNCFCAAEGDWPQTPRLTTASLACSNGAQITRYCNSFGQWEEADASACGCSPANGYLETLLNATATTSCDLGSRSATCLPPYGQWGEDDLSNCFCRASYYNGDMWPETRAGSPSLQLACGVGFRTRQCLPDGTWDDVSYDNCHCPADEEGDWPEAAPGETVNVTCQNGAVRTRRCKIDGTWDAPDFGQCMCPQDFTIPATAPGAVAAVDCQNGHFTRQCLITGFWAETADYSQCQCADPENVWAPASVNSFAYINCGEGQKKRFCTPYGFFEEAVDYNECYCPTDGDFPRAQANTTSSVTCSDTDTTHTKTRYCDPDGNWAVEDNSQCVVVVCPQDGIWSETTPGRTLTRGCSNGGQMSRVCNNDGQWSEISYADCKCHIPNTDILAEVGATYAVPCSLGQTAYYCNPATGAFDEPDRSSCRCAAEGAWEETAPGISKKVNCPGAGFSTRLCNFNGFWEAVDSSECACVAEDVWTETEAGLTHLHNCDSGYVTRVCNEVGRWEPVENNDCNCLESGVLYPLDFVIREACNQGERYKTCHYGQFTDFVSDGCACDVDGIWPITPSNTPITLHCADQGSLSRACLENGSWTEVSVNGCACAATADGAWPLTPYAETVSAPCGENFTGERVRTCTKDGWGAIDASACRPYCFYEGARIAVGESVTAPCSVGERGNITLTCEYSPDTQTSSLVSTSFCERIMCPVEGEWPAMVAGGSQILPCPVGYSGQYLRECHLDGTWGEVADQCERNFCPEEDGYPRTPSMTVGEKSCQPGYSGTLSRYCNANGEWQEEEGVCTQNFCPEEGEWPRTPALERVSGQCPEEIGYTGTYTRLCTADGTWEPLSQGLYDSCTALPLNTKFYPDDGAKYVSRRPTIRIYPDYMPFDTTPLDGCQPTISREGEVYNLVFSPKKYTNAILLDFPPNQFLDYGTYTVSIPPCWTSSNGQKIPYSTYTYTISTGVIAPPAVQSVTIAEDAADPSKIAVSFVPAENKSGSPVVEYVLAFEPPVHAPISILGTETAFPSFTNPNVPTFNVLVIPRNSIGYGASRSATYTLNVATYRPEILLDVFVDTGLPVAGDEGKVSVDLHIALLNSVSASIFPSFAVKCSNDQNVPMTPVPLIDFTTSGYTYSDLVLENKDTLFTCFAVNTVNNLEGDMTTYNMNAFAFPEDENVVYGPIEDFESRFVSSHVVELLWNPPAVSYTHSPITHYVISKSVVGLESLVTFTTYGLSQSIEVVDGENVVTITAVSADNKHSAPFSHTITASINSTLDYDAIASVSAQATFATVAFATTVPIAGRCTLQGAPALELAFSDGAMTGVFNGLAPSSVYNLACSFDGIENAYAASFTTAAFNEGNSVSIQLPEEEHVYSVPLTVTSQVPGEVFCQEFLESNTYAFTAFKSSITNDIFAGQFKPIRHNVPVTYTLYDLYSDTSYVFYCAVRYTDPVKKAYVYNYSPMSSVFVTSHYHPDFLKVVSVEPSFVDVSSKPVFTLTFNSQIDVDDHSETSFAVFQCGGEEMRIKLTSSMVSADMLSLRIPVTDFALPPKGACSLYFSNYGAVRTLNKAYVPTEVYDGILSSDVFNLNGLPSSTFVFSVSSDNLNGHLTLQQGIWDPNETSHLVFLFDDSVSLADSFAYTVQCGQMVKEFTSSGNTKASVSVQSVHLGLTLYTGLLPAGESCTVRIPQSAITDAAGNPFYLGDVIPEVYEATFTTSIQTVEITLAASNPAAASTNVPLRTSFSLTFNRPVVAVEGKTVTVQCTSCTIPQSLQVTPACDLNTNTCTFKPAEFLVPSSEYEVLFDDGTFRNAYGNEYASFPGGLTFTTAENDCSLDFIVEDWNDLCSCTNTGTHCQCSCGSIAVLREF